MGITTMQRRYVVRVVISTAAESGETIAPWEQIDAVEQHFADEDDLLAEMHQEWVRLLSSRLHRGEITARRTPANVRDLYDALAAEHATLRGILDAHDANPALWEPTSREHALLARIAGLAEENATAEQAAAQGRALVHQRIPTQRGAIR